MDNIELLKSRLRSARAESNFASLGYSQHLEIACRLAFGAPSANHFMASSAEYSLSLPISIFAVLERIQQAEDLLPALQDQHEIKGYERLDRWELAAALWAQLAQAPKVPSSLLWLISQTEEIDDLPLPMMMGQEGKPVSVLDPASNMPPKDALRFVLTSWLPYKEGPKRSLLTQLWDELEQIAVSNGLTYREANYYRSICRESYNHGWSLESMILLGILDVRPDDASFFKRFPTSSGAMETLRMVWQEEEPELAP